MFRNVRTEPRQFQFKSRHLPELDPKWAERKERIEAEVQAEHHPEAAAGRPIRFRNSRTASAGDSSWRERRQAQVKGARYAMLRAAVIAAGLLWLAWKGVIWVETSDFSDVLKWMEDA